MLLRHCHRDARPPKLLQNPCGRRRADGGTMKRLNYVHIMNV